MFLRQKPSINSIVLDDRADVKLAEEHSLANSVKRTDVNPAERQICQCCQNYIPLPQDRLSFWKTDTLDLYFLGSGFPIYFALLKRLAILMGVISLFIVGALVL